MPTAWGGPDPTPIVDPGDYEMGTRWRANQQITTQGIRIHTGALEVGLLGRKAHLWTDAGVLLTSVTLPTDLPTGWSVHHWDTAVTFNPGQKFITSFSCYGNYSFSSSVLNVDVLSADGAVTALANGTDGIGNGIYNNTPGLFPSVSAFGGFLGVDFVYTLGPGTPRITNLTATVTGAIVTATMTVEDDETLVGATYSIDWGDGSAPTTGVTTAQHTYAASGTYAILVSVTDASGLSAYDAIPVTIYLVPPGALAFYDVLDTIVDAVLAALTNTDAGAPDRSCVVNGAIAWDECECGQLAGTVIRYFFSDSFPNTVQGGITGACRSANVVAEMAVSILRCAPGPKGQKMAPECSELEESAQTVMIDAHVTRNTIACLLEHLKENDLIIDYLIGDQTTVGPDGACVGSDIGFFIELNWGA